MGKLFVGLLASVRRAPALRKLEWAGILAPFAFLVLYNYLVVSPAHSLLHSSWGIVVLAIALGLAVTAFSRSVFRTISRLQKNVQEL